MCSRTLRGEDHDRREQGTIKFYEFRIAARAYVGNFGISGERGIWICLDGRRERANFGTFAADDASGEHGFDEAGEYSSGASASAGEAIVTGNYFGAADNAD